MKAEISIPKQLLAEIDFMNTLNGGIALSPIKASREKKGYRMHIKLAGIDPENIKIVAENKRFMVYHTVSVLEGEGAVPHYLVNLPLSPEVDIAHIRAHCEGDNLYIFAPFNDWQNGTRHVIDIEN